MKHHPRKTRWCFHSLNKSIVEQVVYSSLQGQFLGEELCICVLSRGMHLLPTIFHILPWQGAFAHVVQDEVVHATLSAHATVVPKQFHAIFALHPRFERLVESALHHATVIQIPQPTLNRLLQPLVLSIILWDGQEPQMWKMRMDERQETFCDLVRISGIDPRYRICKGQRQVVPQRDA